MVAATLEMESSDSMCVFSLTYPACNALAPYCIYICGPSGCTICFHIIAQTTTFKKFENEMCDMILSRNYG
jgi:hypothetical protein